jgi:hypothetical protein
MNIYSVYVAIIFCLMFQALLRRFTVFTVGEMGLKLDCVLDGRHFGSE